jgi:hypothetical protein
MRTPGSVSTKIWSPGPSAAAAGLEDLEGRSGALDGGRDEGKGTTGGFRGEQAVAVPGNGDVAGVGGRVGGRGGALGGLLGSRLVVDFGEQGGAVGQLVEHGLAAAGEGPALQRRDVTLILRQDAATQPARDRPLRHSYRIAPTACASDAGLAFVVPPSGGFSGRAA